jgi:hypothetical protein
MKRLLSIIVCSLFATSVSAADFHVSPDGSDENPAAANAPVKSLEKARDLARAARKAKPEESIQILLHPGIYMVRKTVELTEDDSGTGSAPLTIRAWKDPTSPQDWPKLVGGVVVSGWKEPDFSDKALEHVGVQPDSPLQPGNGGYRLHLRRRLDRRLDHDPLQPLYGQHRVH